MHGFIWNGKDKVKRSVLINDVEHGGLKMLDIECMIKAQRIMCLKKYIEDYVSPWKILLDYYLGNVGGKFILKCQFDTCKLPISLPVFYEDYFDAWSFLAKTDVVTYGDIMNQVIWNNKNILSQGKSIYQPLFHKCGIITVGDLISNDRAFLKSEKVLKAQLSPSQLFVLMVNASPSEWRSIMKGNAFFPPSPSNESSYFLSVKGEMMDILNIRSKNVYKKFCFYKSTPPTAQAKWEGNYPSLLSEWTKIYSLPFKVTLDTNLRAFQYRFLNRIVYTNYKLFAFKIVDSPYCTFCKNEAESPEHLFFFCKVADMFWKEVLSWIALSSNEVKDISDVSFGKFNINKDFIIINHVLLLAKFFIYRYKLDKKEPSLDVLRLN